MNTKNKIIKTSHPNELWVCDLIGRLASKDGENKFIFIAVDHYTKWIETEVIDNKKGDTIANIIENLIIKKHGTPSKILSDNGTEFINSDIMKLRQKCNFDWILNSPGHHDTVGAVERANQTFMNKLLKLSNNYQKNWEELVNETTMAMNISFNRAIQSCPMLLMYGGLPDLKIDKKLKIEEYKEPILNTRSRRDTNFTNNRYNLKIGDQAAIYKANTGAKMKSNWILGFVIKKKILPDAYLVSKRNNELRVNKKHVKKIKEGEKGV